MARRAAQDQNLDPLLDTMANVVGILVMLVAVTQLSVGEAVERIRERGVDLVIEAWMVEEAEQERARIEDALVSAKGELAAMPPTEKRRGMLLEEANPALEILEALPGRDELAGLNAEALRRRIEQDTEEVEQLKASVADGRRRLLRLNEVLTDLPAERRPKIARLPDPRPPPPGYKEAAFFCRYGRVDDVDLEAMKQLLHIGIRDALGQDRRVERSDRPWLVNLFRKETFGEEGFYWTFRASEKSRLFADVAWRDRSQGEGVSDLRLGDSAFQGALTELKGQRRFLRFYVWTDSFDAYLEARYIAEQQGFSVSWLAVDAEDEVGIDLEGGRRAPILID